MDEMPAAEEAALLWVLSYDEFSGKLLRGTMDKIFRNGEEYG